MLVMLAIFSGLVAKIAMPTPGAVLTLAALGSLRPGEAASIMPTGRISQVAVIAPSPPRYCRRSPRRSGIGVALSLLLQVNAEAMDLAVADLDARDDGA